MEKETHLGMNRTGVQVAPRQSERMLEGVRQMTQLNPAVARTPQDLPDRHPLAGIRSQYAAEAEALGSIPPPGSLKGIGKTGVQMLAGRRPQLLIDKLGQRLAFERGGTRLYEALIVKYEAGEQKPDGQSLGRLQQIRDEEASHVELVARAIETLGGDPTVQTPCADLVGVQSLGLMQSLTDPRTSFLQGLDTVLIAELTDTASWELLIEVAQQFGQDDMVEEFRGAHAREMEHLRTVQDWQRALTLGETKVMGRA